MDIVVANSGTHTIGIFISKADGTFENQQTYSTGSQSRPYSIVSGDFNNDTFLDIAVANYATNSIGILLGNGNGTFIDQKLFSLGSSRPVFVTIGNVNNDNQIDLIIANDGTNSIGILLGNGDGSFQGPRIYSTGYDSMPSSLAVGDFNKDNQQDIAVANYGTSNIGILLGSGNGSFADQIIYTTIFNSHPPSVTVGDINNDTHLDIIVANYGTSCIGIFLNRGNGSFSPQTTYSTGLGSLPQFITLGYFDENRYADIVVVDSENDRIHIFPGYGNGTFSKITTYDTISGSRPFSVAVSDFDNDNQSDIVAANYGTNNILILNGYSIKPTTRQINYQDKSGSGATTVAVGDFNNDHIPDIVFNAIYSIVTIIGVGNGTFDKLTTYPAGIQSTPQYICVGDLNNDNRTDIIGSNPDTDTMSIFLGYGDGTFATVMSYPVSTRSDALWITLNDINNDHRLDLVSANLDTNSVSIFLGNGDGTFGTIINYSTGNNSGPYSVVVGDINNDKYLDIAVGNAEGSVGIYLGYGNGSFTNMTKFAILGSPFSIILADFNSDHNLDIAVTIPSGNHLNVFLGYGDGMFAAQTTYSTGIDSSPYGMVAADFNGDSIYDIAVTNSGTDEVIILYGYGNGNFTLARTYSTGFGSNPYSITAADLDNDKQLEIIVSLYGTAGTAILTEYYAAEFVSEILYSTGSTPRLFSIAVGDFNNDNRSDVVVANSGTDNIGLLPGLGNGTFGTEMTYSIGADSHPQYVITCDINKDNDLDIISVSSQNNSISIIMGYGNMTFAKQMIYSTGDDSNPYAVASNDLNNDKQLDIIVANKGIDSIGIFYQFNYTSFQNQAVYSSNDSLGPTGIVVDDFNNDGLLDIAVVFTGSDNFGILLGYRNGSFSDIRIYAIGKGFGPAGMIADDFNKDGRLDLAVTSLGDHNIGILLGFGNGSFSFMMTSSTAGYAFPVGIAAGDFNNDGRMDILVADVATNIIGVHLGYGNGTFSIGKIYSTGDRSNPYAVAVDDLNNDTRLDIVVAYRGTNLIAAFLGYGDGNFGAPVTFSTGAYSNPAWVIINDFNNDSRLDVATSNSNTNTVGILLGYGNGTFASVITYSTGSGAIPNCISAGDFNNDQKLDIAVANSATNDIVVLFGLGDGNFLLGTAFSTGADSSPFILAIGDFNNDAQLDIAVTNNLANNIVIFLAYGTDTFAGMTTYSTGDGSQPHSVATGDLNNDGRSDIIVANYGTDNVGVFLGHTNGIFDTMIIHSTGNGSAPYSVAVDDFNKDHNLDIVVTNSETDNVVILLGFGDGTFGIAVMYSTGARSRPYSVAISDFNNDNILDIVVANSGTSNIFLLYGDGKGRFNNETSYALGYEYQPYSVATTDLNDDGWMDIVTACYGTDHIETFIKMC